MADRSRLRARGDAFRGDDHDTAHEHLDDVIGWVGRTVGIRVRGAAEPGEPEGPHHSTHK